MSRTYERERPSDGQRRRSPSPSTSSNDQADLEALQQAVGNRGMAQLLDPAASEAIESRLGGGKPLDQAAPVPAEAKDAAQEARLHDDATSAELAERMGAVAFTFGSDVFLAGDAPDLASAEGQRVLRHELTHVEQFDGAELGRPRGVSDPEGAAEQQAAHVADGASAAPAAAVHRQEVEEEEDVAAMAAETVHRQGEEEETDEWEEAQMMPAETVRRQPMEEEEELLTMPAETVHRQEMPEEEPAVMGMPAETVHRQEELPEETLAFMPAETVHRQEDEDEGEEIAMTMSAETVHRDEEEEVEEATEEAEEVAPANPALAALWNSTVLGKIMEASEQMGADPPGAEAAHAALEEASDAIHALMPVYEESDPLLRMRLGRESNGVLAIMIALAPLAGHGTTSLEWIRTALGTRIERAAEMGLMLH